MRPDAPPASAVAVRAGRIVRVGGDADVLALDLPGAEVLDLAGRTVLPGLLDRGLVVAGGSDSPVTVLDPDADPFEEPGAIKDIPVALTMCRGVVTHAADGAF